MRIRAGENEREKAIIGFEGSCFRRGQVESPERSLEKRVTRRPAEQHKRRRKSDDSVAPYASSVPWLCSTIR
eukprot:1648519-Rhodomonas_salina.1